MGNEEYLFGIVLTFAGGTFFYHNLARLRIPYTVIMFLFGMVMGIIGISLPTRYAVMFDGLASIEPEIVFHIFLPVLIFEGSYGMRIHAFRSVFYKVLMLAYPGLIINTIFIALALKLILVPEWNLFLALLVGSLLSATDPVAVVALLKDLGVDKRTTACIDGEAIMNDGTAIIAFTLFLPAAVSGSFNGTWDSILLQCLQLTLGATVFGLFMGYITEFFLLKAQNNPLVQTCTTVSLAYAAFYCADVFLKTSGVITLCFMGVYLSTYMPTLFPGREDSVMNNTWHFLVHLANTVLFSLVGIIIVREALSSINFIDVAFMVFLYLIAVVARFLMLLMLLPLLNLHKGYVMGIKDICLFVHGGLRGGVATVLALIVAQTDGINREDQIMVLLLTCGIVILTLIVNATTSQAVVAILGHKRKDLNRIVQMQIGVQHVANEAERSLQIAKLRSVFRNVNWGFIANLIKELHNPYDDMATTVENEDIMFNVLLMRAFKTEVWNMRDADHISENVVRVLTTSLAQNIASGTMITTDDLQPHMQYPIWLRWLSKHVDPDGFIGRILASRMTAYDEDHFGILLGYNWTLKKVELMYETYVMNDTQANEAEQWLGNEKAHIAYKIKLFAQNRPKAAVAVMTKMAAETVVQGILHSAHLLHEKHGFSIPATESLVHSVEALRHSIHSWPSEMPEIEPQKIIEDSELLKGLSTNSYHLIAQHVETYVFNAQDLVTITDSVGIVMSGVVGAYGSRNREFGPGNVFNIGAFNTKQHQSKYFAFADQTVVLAIKYTDLQSHLLIDYPLSRSIWRLIAKEVFQPLINIFLLPYRTWSASAINDMIDSGRVEVIETAHSQSDNSGGEIMCYLSGQDEKGLITNEMAPFIVPATLVTSFMWEKSTVLFHFIPKLDEDTLGSNARQQIFDISSSASASSESVLHSNNKSNADTITVAMTTADYDSEGIQMTASQIQRKHRRFSAILTLNSSSSLNASGDCERQILSVAVRANSILAKYNYSQCLSGIPFFNQLQMHFILEYEQLSVGVIDYERTPLSHTSRTEISATIKNALEFLTRYCVEFSAEEQLYKACVGAEEARSTVLITLLDFTEHIKEHNEFIAQVSLWRERLLYDDLCHDDILLGMANFAVNHFVTDKRMFSFVIRNYESILKVIRRSQIDEILKSKVSSSPTLINTISQDFRE